MKSIWSRDKITTLLQNRILSGIANGRLAQGYLFVGGSKEQKFNFALGLAQERLCQKISSGRACGECGACLTVEKNQSPGFICVESEKSQVKIEAVRNVIRQLSISSVCSARFVCIREAESLNAQATNALLKILEEPPPHTHFILLSPTRDSVSLTLRSRCLVLRFSNSSLENEVHVNSGAATDILSVVDEVWKNLENNQLAEAVELIRTRVDGREDALEFVRIWHRRVREEWYNEKSKHSSLASLSEILLSTERNLLGFGDVQLNLENTLISAREIL